VPNWRYMLTLPALAIVLVAAVAGAAAWTWGYQPLSLAGTLVAQDQIAPADSRCDIRATLVPLQPGLPVRSWTATVESPGSLRLAAASLSPYCVQQLTVPPGQYDPVTVKFRLSPEAGFGPLSATSTLFVLRPVQKILLIDLEAIGSSGRYELIAGNRERLVRRQADRMPLYLADAQLKDYNRLRAELQKAGWPAGPLMLWRFTSDGQDASKADTIRRLAGRLSGRISVAVTGDEKDNRDAFSQYSKVVRWSDDVWE
jgi:hypothetical protein